MFLADPIELSTTQKWFNYDNGGTDTIAQGQTAESHKKLLKNKRKTKDGTIYTLNKVIIAFGDQTLELPYVQFVVKK
jgi:hypothetical protein